eukprot:Rhum_TRINITY_DN14920_c7_g1::Rhum_TRINITY_DN14920_c7_g1_i1::g.127614::m.127614
MVLLSFDLKKTLLFFCLRLLLDVLVLQRLRVLRLVPRGHVHDQEGEDREREHAADDDRDNVLVLKEVVVVARGHEVAGLAAQAVERLRLRNALHLARHVVVRQRVVRHALQRVARGAEHHGGRCVRGLALVLGTQRERLLGGETGDALPGVDVVALHLAVPVHVPQARALLRDKAPEHNVGGARLRVQELEVRGPHLNEARKGDERRGGVARHNGVPDARAVLEDAAAVHDAGQRLEGSLLLRGHRAEREVLQLVRLLEGHRHEGDGGGLRVARVRHVRERVLVARAALAPVAQTGGVVARGREVAVQPAVRVAGAEVGVHVGGRAALDHLRERGLNAPLVRANGLACLPGAVRVRQAGARVRETRHRRAREGVEVRVVPHDQAGGAVELLADPGGGGGGGNDIPLGSGAPAGPGRVDDGSDLDTESEAQEGVLGDGVAHSGNEVVRLPVGLRSGGVQRPAGKAVRAGPHTGEGRREVVARTRLGKGGPAAQAALRLGDVPLGAQGVVLTRIVATDRVRPTKGRNHRAAKPANLVALRRHLQANREVRVVVGVRGTARVPAGDGLAPGKVLNRRDEGLARCRRHANLTAGELVRAVGGRELQGDVDVAGLGVAPTNRGGAAEVLVGERAAASADSGLAGRRDVTILTAVGVLVAPLLLCEKLCPVLERRVRRDRGQQHCRDGLHPIPTCARTTTNEVQIL